MAIHNPQSPTKPPASLAAFLVLRSRDQVAIAAMIVVLALFPLAQRVIGGSGNEPASAPQPAQFLVDVNAASWAELAQLPRVGETLAGRIVELRTERGGFRSVEELRDVRGIGAKTLDRLRPYLAPIDSPAPAAETPGNR